MDKKSPPRKRGLRLLLAALVMGLAVGSVGMFSQVRASDHDDGETNIKSRNLSLTDLYVFREDWQTGNAADANNLIFIMGTNGRSVARQQYFFNTSASYNFNIGRQATRNATVTGTEDLRMAFTFGAPDATSSQAISLTLSGAGLTTTTVSAGRTTPAPILLSNQQPASSAVVANPITVNGQQVTVFAGIREDPFYFDEDAFFRTRALVGGNVTSASLVNPPGFSPDASTSTDTYQGFNINAIVVRVPIALLQGPAAERVFDVWETITLPSNIAANQ